MSRRVQCEFSLIRYVPDVVKGEFANIGVLLREAVPNGTARVKFTRDWARVRCLDPGADVALLESLEVEIAERLERGVDPAVNAKPMLETLEEWLSNSVQLTDMRATLAENLPAEMEQLLKMYVEPMKASVSRRKQSGRAAIAAQMRSAFESTGAWQLMRKRIAASQYTQPGDPLKIDCGYRNGRVRMFHAVSLESDVEGAKGLAYSAAALREGVSRAEGRELELTAIVERIGTVSEEEQYRFGVSVMESSAIRVLTVADLGRVAETAKTELRT